MIMVNLSTNGFYIEQCERVLMIMVQVQMEFVKLVLEKLVHQKFLAVVVWVLMVQMEQIYISLIVQIFKLVLFWTIETILTSYSDYDVYSMVKVFSGTYEWFVEGSRLKGS